MARLAQGLLQADLALRAGVARGTIVTLENKGQCTLHSFVRIVQALGLVDQLGTVFAQRVGSIADMEKQASTPRVRASRKAAQTSR